MATATEVGDPDRQAAGGAGVPTLAEAVGLDLIDVTRVGPDLRFAAVVRRKES